MENKYFKPADFSDFEETLESKRIVVDIFPLPNKEEVKIIRQRLESEFNRCETGTSKLTNRAIQSSSTIGTKNLMNVMLETFNDSTVLSFLEMVKQDFGLTVAEWCAQDVLASYSAVAIKKAGEWRRNG